MANKEFCDKCDADITGDLTANDARLDLESKKKVFAIRLHSIGTQLCFKCMKEIVNKGGKARTGDEARLKI
jgi:hypothetical protein